MRWEQRLLAPTVSFPAWSIEVPDLLFFTSDDGGVLQVWSLDLTTQERKALTDQELGVEEFVVDPQARFVAWWSDDTGNEFGGWLCTDVATLRTRPLVNGVPAGWSQGIALAAGRAAVGVSTAESFSIWVQDADADRARCLLEALYPLGLGREWETTAGGLSTDATLVCVRHAEFGDMLHFGLRVLDADSGETVAEILDDGLNLKVCSWSPVVGDQRVMVIHEREGVERPALWSPVLGRLRDYSVDLPGPIDVLDWWPDAQSVLLVHRHHGRDSLHRLDLATGDIALVHDAIGHVSGAAVRPNGEVWLRSESATRAPVVHDLCGTVVMSTLGAPPEPGQRHQMHDVPTGGGSAHMLLTTPQGEAPFPTVMVVHGGPEWHYSDDLDPWEQALVDSGLAVAKVNYRGSTGSTVAWRTAIQGGNIGFPEVSDVIAGVNYLVESGLADPTRLAIEGRSWGGYVTLLAIGLHPSLFKAAVAVVPVADSLLTHEDCSPPQQAYDIAVMGGSPSTVRERYVERSPITYVDDVTTPLLMIAGEFDSACPIRQVRAYDERLRARGADVTLEVYEAGHHANAKSVQLQHARLALDFLCSRLLDERIATSPPRD